MDWGGGGGGGLSEKDKDTDALRDDSPTEWFRRRERKRSQARARALGVLKSLQQDEEAEQAADFAHVESRFEAERAQHNILMCSETRKDVRIHELDKTVAELMAELQHAGEAHLRALADEERKHAEVAPDGWPFLFQ